MLKHATASVFLLTRSADGWRMFGWFTRDELNALGMLDDGRSGAHLLLDRIEMLAANLGA